MAFAVSYNGTGAGRKRVAAMGDKVMNFVTGTIDFDSSYPTGGEDISGIFDQFSNCLGIVFESKDGYTFSADYSGQKVLAYWVDTSTDGAAQAQVVDTTDLSSITGVRFLAWGY